MKKKYISWQEHQGLVLNICRQIANSDWKPDYIVGIGRGGLTTATMISHWLDIPMQSLDVSLRDHSMSCTNCGMSEDAFEGKNILVVDDINDSGATVEWIVNDWESTALPGDEKWESVWNNTVKFAVVVDNLASECDYRMDFIGCEIDKAKDDVWICFPWEEFWR